MPIKVEKQKKIIDILEILPPDMIDEILDFAEYLKKKIKPLQKTKKKPSLKIPTFHLGHIAKEAFDRKRLYGEYLDRKFD